MSYDLIDPMRFLLTKAVGELCAALMDTGNKEYGRVSCESGKLFIQYFLNDLSQSDVEIAAANVLDLFGLIDPSKMTSKLKLHLLVHLTSRYSTLGPLVGVITETFESFNAIFRFCSVYSNHLAPSRDIRFPN